MNAPMPRVPASETGDSSDVAVALEVAAALWDKGDNEEAIRWLRRGAEAAGQSGHDSRAASLVQAAAALEAALEVSRGAATQSVPGAIATPTAPSMSAAQARVPTLALGAGPPVPGVAGTWSVLEGRMRVSVKTSARDPDLLLLRPLPEGQSAPVGTREGFLVLAEHEVDPPNPSNGGGPK
jgi:hypothetical protein